MTELVSRVHHTWQSSCSPRIYDNLQPLDRSSALFLLALVSLFNNMGIPREKIE